MICPECGTPMILSSEPVKETYRNETFVLAGFTRYACPECGNDIMSAQEATRLGRALAEKYAQRHGLLTASQIKEIRKSLGLTQKELERLIGVASPTVSRWETGAMQQSATADKLLRLIRDVPAAADYLRAQYRAERRERPRGDSTTQEPTLSSSLSKRPVLRSAEIVEFDPASSAEAL